MPYTSLEVAPGINVEFSPLANKGAWSYSSAIRFRDGKPEKTGGWAHLNNEKLTGVCTGIHSWADLQGNLYIACGTDQMLELFFGGALYDITPLRKTDDLTPAFTTVALSTTVNIKDVANGAAAGDWIYINVPVSVGGIILQGAYRITSRVDADNYHIESADAAASSVVNGGAVPVFDTTNGNADVKVTLANHGYVVGDIFPVQVETTVGGVTIQVGSYSIIAPVTANTFFITPAGAATSTTTGGENGGNAQLQYLVPTGLQSATYETSSGGWGVGDYGAGDYGGGGSGTILVPLRQWFLDNFGQDLIGNYTRSPIFVWAPPNEPGNRALAINTANFPEAIAPPQSVVFSFVAGPQQMVIAGGCTIDDTADFDPNLLRWCDQSNFTDWRATSTNQAGSFRFPSGSRLVGGIWSPNFIAIWTDVDMWLMAYLGGTGLSQLVWGFNKVAGATGLLSARACAVFRNLVFYASSNGVYAFDGSKITLIPCPVWDKFWKNLNRQQVDKVNMEVNSYFQELAISSPSADGDGTIDQRITYNIRENTWTYDDRPTLLARTAWIDENVYGAPAGTDLAGYIQQQDTEGVYDADGVALPSMVRTGWFSVQEGTLVSMIERIEGDFIDNGGTGTVQITVYTQDYATGPVRTYGPYNWTVGSGPPWQIVRARGRFFSIQISSTDLGVFWRLGNTRFYMMPAGRRP